MRFFTRLLLLLILASVLHGNATEGTLLPGVYCEYTTDSKGEVLSHTYIFTGEKRIPESPLERISSPHGKYTDTTVLWVDRSHLNAVAEDVTITGDGMNITTGWWLNNERVSLYRSLKDEIPIWHYSMPLSNWMIDVASSMDGHLIAAASSGAPFMVWDKISSIPMKVYYYPAAFKSGQCAVSADGSVAVVAADNGSTGRLFAFNKNGDSLYAVDFDRGNGIYGVELSSDGSIALVSTYYVHSIFENGVLRETIANYGQTAAALSADGNRIVKGDFYGKVTLYEWNGTVHVQLWESTIGGPWVATVDISDDGSTIIAGTGYSNGKTVMFDAASSTPLWTYQNYGSYGAYVRAARLSSDGSMGVAASWGDTAQTGTFYVLTVHAKNDPAPIIGVTRNEEPGSLFDCAISANGENITAGGKAVHAYQMGNGGEVYSILVGSTPSLNAATESIDSPGHLVQVNAVISPTATFANYGDDTASFNVFFSIEDSTGTTIYSSSGTIPDLAPGATLQEIFSPDWIPAEYNYYKAYAWCELTGDQYSGDDTLCLIIKCYHDAEAKHIDVPFHETTINMQIAPQAVIYNNGSYTETIEAVFTIRDSLGIPICVDTTFSSALAPETEATISFTPISPANTGNHSGDITVNVAEDIDPGNDTTSKPFYVSYEIIYDDGVPEAFYIVGSTYENNKFAVKFTPTLSPPFSFTGGRIYVNATTALDYVQLCSNASGLPDTIAPLREVYNVSAPAPLSWAEFTFDTFEVTALNDFWIVMHWDPSSPNSPGIGADNFSPTSRSWWYNVSNGWNNWTSHNWMIRLMQSTNPSGIQTHPSGAPRCYKLHNIYPNPFYGRCCFAFDVPEETNCLLEIYDVSGRMIKTINNSTLKPGYYTMKWDGKDNLKKHVASGVYFYRLKTKSFSMTKKIVYIQ